MSRGQRRGIVAPNVYGDANGLRAIVTVSPLRRQERSPHDIDLTIVQTWQAMARRRMDQAADYLAFLFDQLGMTWTPPAAQTTIAR
jgi:hypothetical protein